MLLWKVRKFLAHLIMLCWLATCMFREMFNRLAQGRFIWSYTTLLFKLCTLLEEAQLYNRVPALYLSQPTRPIISQFCCPEIRGSAFSNCKKLLIAGSWASKIMKSLVRHTGGDYRIHGSAGPDCFQPGSLLLPSLLLFLLLLLFICMQHSYTWRLSVSIFACLSVCPSICMRRLESKAAALRLGGRGEPFNPLVWLSWPQLRDANRLSRWRWW